MRYAGQHEISHLCMVVNGGGAYSAREGLTLPGRLRLASVRILLASARRECAPPHCQTVGLRRPDNTRRGACLQCYRPPGPAEGLVARQADVCLVFDPEQTERLQALLHRSPRDFGKPKSVWTLQLAAEVSVAAGIIPTQVSGETIRQTL